MFCGRVLIAVCVTMHFSARGRMRAPTRKTMRFAEPTSAAFPSMVDPTWTTRTASVAGDDPSCGLTRWVACSLIISLHVQTHHHRTGERPAIAPPSSSPFSSPHAPSCPPQRCKHPRAPCLPPPCPCPHPYPPSLSPFSPHATRRPLGGQAFTCPSARGVGSPASLDYSCFSHGVPHRQQPLPHRKHGRASSAQRNHGDRGGILLAPSLLTHHRARPGPRHSMQRLAQGRSEIHANGGGTGRWLPLPLVVLCQGRAGLLRSLLCASLRQPAGRTTAARVEPLRAGRRVDLPRR